LSESLAEDFGRAAFLAAAAESEKVFDFAGVGDFGQGLNAGRREGDEEQLVADTDPLHLLAGRERRSAAQLDSVFRKRGVPRRSEAKRAPDDDQEHADDGTKAAANRD